jgi:hypothetical protein
MTSSNILIWHNEVGFIKINEGDGSNLLPEDEAEGYVDYIMMDFIEYDGYDFTETDGAQVMLTEMYQEKFESETEVVHYLIDCSWIPDLAYVYLYME